MQVKKRLITASSRQRILTGTAEAGDAGTREEPVGARSDATRALGLTDRTHGPGGRVAALVGGALVGGIPQNCSRQLWFGDAQSQSPQGGQS